MLLFSRGKLERSVVLTLGVRRLTNNYLRTFSLKGVVGSFQPRFSELFKTFSPFCFLGLCLNHINPRRKIILGKPQKKSSSINCRAIKAQPPPPSEIIHTRHSASGCGGNKNRCPPWDQNLKSHLNA